MSEDCTLLLLIGNLMRQLFMSHGLLKSSHICFLLLCVLLLHSATSSSTGREFNGAAFHESWSSHIYFLLLCVLLLHSATCSSTSSLNAVLSLSLLQLPSTIIIIIMNLLYSISSIIITFLINHELILVVIADPQTNLLNKICSPSSSTDTRAFYYNLNGTFSDLRSQLRNSLFATAHRGSPNGRSFVAGITQCRNYLSTSDCLACFSAAVSEMRKCSAADGARVVYDGCFLRHQDRFLDQDMTLPGNAGICGNKTASHGNAFSTAVGSLLTDLVTTTPEIRGFYAAGKREVFAGSGTFVYGVAQCAESLNQSTGCSYCLNIAMTNIRRCLPYADGRAVDAGCFLRYSDTAFFSDNQTTELFLIKETGDVGPVGSNSLKKGTTIGGVVAGTVFLLALVVLVVVFRLRRRNHKRAESGILGATVNFSYKDLKIATKGFSEKNKLGEGGFGDVYKGVLKNGKIVAVKRLAVVQSKRAKQDFESEVKLISDVQHPNLIRLLGCCNKRQELLLVYEFMVNSSLDKYIYGNSRATLNWKQRFDIIVGIARGLAYLHDECPVCIIHRDIKSSNILLDDAFQAKIADFGLARLLPENQTHLTTRFAGTLGYTAPEYAIHGKLSEKVDTYSFGIVVLEIISGRRSNDIQLEPVVQYLLEMAWTLYEENSSVDLVDSSLKPDEYNTDEFKRVIEIALSCTQSSVALRPTMSEVVILLLTRGRLPERTPTRPTFIDSTNRVHGDIYTSTGSSTSNATVSFTEVSVR